MISELKVDSLVPSVVNEDHVDRVAVSEIHEPPVVAVMSGVSGGAAGRLCNLLDISFNVYSISFIL